MAPPLALPASEPAPLQQVAHGFATHACICRWPADSSQGRRRRRRCPCIRRSLAAPCPAPAAGKRAAGDESGSEDEGQHQPRKALEDMSIDEFLQGGFLEAAPAGAAGDDSDGALRGLPGGQAIKDWHVERNTH